MPERRREPVDVRWESQAREKSFDDSSMQTNFFSLLQIKVHFWDLEACDSLKDSGKKC